MCFSFIKSKSRDATLQLVLLILAEGDRERRERKRNKQRRIFELFIMDFKKAKAKKFAPYCNLFPLPLKTEKPYIGVFNGYNVTISDFNEITDVYFMVTINNLILLMALILPFQIKVFIFFFFFVGEFWKRLFVEKHPELPHR